MRQKEILIDPVDVDADGIAQSQSITSGAAVTLNGALITDSEYDSDYPRRLGVVSAGDDSGITFTFTGTDPEGKSQTEALTGSTGGTVTTTAYFNTVTSVVTSGATAGNITVGTVDELVTPVVQVNHYNSEPAVVSFEDFTGTINASVEQSFSRIQYSDIEYSASPVTAMTGTTSAVYGEMTRHATGIRAKVNSYSSGAEFKMVINQDR